MSARDWLDDVRRCAGQLDGLHLELKMLKDARDHCLPWKTKGAPIYGSMGGTCSNPTQTEALSRIDGLDDQIATLTAKVHEYERTVGDCLRMLDIMRCQFGECRADVIELYYVDCAGTWSEVAVEMRVSRRTVCRWRDEAIRWITCHCPRYDMMG